MEASTQTEEIVDHQEYEEPACELVFLNESEWGLPCQKCSAKEMLLAVARDNALYNHQVVCQKMGYTRCKVLAATDVKTRSKELSRLRKLYDVAGELRRVWLVAEDDVYAARNCTVNCLVHYGIGSRYH